MLREVLAGPDFVIAELTPRQRILRWIEQAISDAWEWLRAQLFDDTGGFLEVLAVLVPLAALVALGAVAYRYGPAWMGGAARAAAGAAEAEDATRSGSDWLRLARRRAGEGAFRPAASALYQGFLLTLDRRGMLAFHPSKTPGDYALEIGRRLGGNDGEPDDVGEAGDGTRFLRSFQQLAFRHDTPTREAYAELEALARAAGCADRTEADGADAP